MGVSPTTYDGRYLAGVLLFNRGDFFEAHEVWESLWIDSTGSERRFYQGLIQAAVALIHFGNGNRRGAAKLYHSSRGYLDSLPSPFLGLSLVTFGRHMERCFAEVTTDPERVCALDEGLIPEIALNPSPAQWPDPTAYLDGDEAQRQGNPDD